MKHEQRHRIAQETVDWIRRRYFGDNLVPKGWIPTVSGYPLSFDALSRAIRESFRLAIHPTPSMTIGDIAAVLHRLQLPIEPERLDGYSELAGFLYAYQGGGIIFIEETDTDERKKFSLAHELGHFINDYYRPIYLKYESSNTIPLFQDEVTAQLRQVISARCTKRDIFRGDKPEFVANSSKENEQLLAELQREQKDQPDRSPAGKFMEIKANLFAAELLMPMMECGRIEYENQGASQEDLTLAVMQRFGVSRSAAAIRVEELRLGVVEEGLM